MITLQILWTYVKKYWIVAAAVATCIVFIVLKQEADAQVTKLLKELADNDARHQAELKQIQESHDTEIAAHDAHLKELETTLDAVEKQYTAAKSQLDDTKREEIRKIVEEYNDNPDELAKRLSEATGIPIVVPEK